VEYVARLQTIPDDLTLCGNGNGNDDIVVPNDSIPGTFV